MPCFCCGKRVSLARQLRDVDFCSDDHRKRYHELGRTALSRLLESSQQHATAAPRLDPPPPPPPVWSEEAAILPPLARRGEITPLAAAAAAPAPHKRHVFEEKRPVFQMPPPAAPAPPSPLGFLAERMLRPTAAACSPALVELEAAGPVFDGDIGLRAPERLELCSRAFFPVLSRVAPLSDVPAHRAAGGGNGFHAYSPHTGRLDAGQELRLYMAERLPVQALILRQPRPATLPTRRERAVSAARRAEPRPVLARMPAARFRSPNLGQSGLIGYPHVIVNRVFPARPAVAAFLEFPRHIQLARFQRRPLRNAVLTCAFESAPRVAVYAGLAAPRAAARQARPVEAGPLDASPLVALPERAARVAAALPETPPPLVEQWSSVPPRLLPAAAAARPAGAAAFARPEFSLPRGKAGIRAASGMREAALELLGFPSVVRPPSSGPARPAGVTLQPRLETALPALPPRRSSRVVVAPGSWMWTAAAAPRRLRSSFAAAVEPALEPAAVSHPRTVAPSALRWLPVAELSFLAAGSGVRGARVALPSAPPQFGAGLDLIELPPLPEAGSRRQVRWAEAAPPARMPRAFAWQFQPQAASGIGFQVEASTPVCLARFESQVVRASYAALPPPRSTAGARTALPAAAAFSAPTVPLPGFVGSAATPLLAAAGPSPAPPNARRIAAGAIAAPAPAIAAATDLLAAPLTAGWPRHASMPSRSDERPPRPPAAIAVAFAMAPPAGVSVELGTFLPPSPGQLVGTHAIRQPAHFPLSSPAAHRITRPAAAEPVPLPLPRPLPPDTPTALRWSPALGSAALRLRDARLLSGARGTLICPWEQPGAGAPEVAGTLAAERPPAKLDSSTLQAAPYLAPPAKLPPPGTRRPAELGFAIQPAELPPPRRLSATQVLAAVEPAWLRPRSFAPALARPLEAAISCPEHEAARPDIAAAERAAVPDSRELQPAALEPVQAGRTYDLSAVRLVRVREVTMALTAAIERPKAKFEPPRRWVLGSSGLKRLAETARRQGARRAAGPAAVELVPPSPAEPRSEPLVARRTLTGAPPIAPAAHSFACAIRTTAAAISAESTQPVALPGRLPLGFAHPLAFFPPLLPKSKARDVGTGRREESWLALGQETAALRFDGIGSSAIGVCWPTAATCVFARERRTEKRRGLSAILYPRLALEFAVPGLSLPIWAGHRPALAPTRLALLAAARSHDDPRTAETTARLAPAFRPVFHPSRLPVFQNAIQKAHMPSGRVFHGFEIEDREDHRTSLLGLPCPAPLSPPAPPEPGFLLRARNRLDAEEPRSVFAGPYGSSPRRDGGLSELPYNPELFFIDTGVRLIGMDFEAIVEAYEPRWRSALKTASGLFRGVMLLVPGLILLSVLSGCSSSSSSSLKESIQDRAAIHMEHDFAGGLEGWYGGPGWAKAWSRDPQGFVRVGQLGLYRPSLQLTDYRLEFLSQIDRRSVGWAYRAADLQNYYATKLVIDAPGPPPQMSLVRYQVVGGQEVQTIKIPLRILVHRNRPLRIQQDVVGIGFTTYIEGEAVDFWTDDRLRAGGVGFLGEKGDQPYLYWVTVASHDDFWGKICAMIAPNN